MAKQEHKSNLLSSYSSLNPPICRCCITSTNSCPLYSNKLCSKTDGECQNWKRKDSWKQKALKWARSSYLWQMSPWMLYRHDKSVLFCVHKKLKYANSTHQTTSFPPKMPGRVAIDFLSRPEHTFEKTAEQYPFSFQSLCPARALSQWTRNFHPFKDSLSFSEYHILNISCSHFTHTYNDVDTWIGQLSMKSITWLTQWVRQPSTMFSFKSTTNSTCMSLNWGRKLQDWENFASHFSSLRHRHWHRPPEVC